MWSIPSACQNVRLIKPGGGRFRVSHKYRCIVVPETIAGNTTAWLVGRLEEPFRFSHRQMKNRKRLNHQAWKRVEHFPDHLTDREDRFRSDRSRVALSNAAVPAVASSQPPTL